MFGQNIQNAIDLIVYIETHKYHYSSSDHSWSDADDFYLMSQITGKINVSSKDFWSIFQFVENSFIILIYLYSSFITTKGAQVRVLTS